MRNMEKIGIFFSVLLICVTLFYVIQTGSTNSQNVPATSGNQTYSTPTPMVISETTIQQKSGQSVIYSTSDLVTGPGSKASRFKMDYPSEWTYIREQVSPSPLSSLIKNGSAFISATDDTKIWDTIFNFSSPDGKSHVYVYFHDYSGSIAYWYPIDSWANATITGLTKTYCVDDAGNPIHQERCSVNQETIYNRVLISNDPVSIKGSLAARKLVFKSTDDKNNGQYTLYLIHSGSIQGYRNIVPGRIVETDGIVWDRGIGGYIYAVEFFFPENQLNSTTDILNHMVNSFEIKR